MRTKKRRYEKNIPEMLVSGSVLAAAPFPGKDTVKMKGPL